MFVAGASALEAGQEPIADLAVWNAVASCRVDRKLRTVDEQLISTDAPAAVAPVRARASTPPSLGLAGEPGQMR